MTKKEVSAQYCLIMSAYSVMHGYVDLFEDGDTDMPPHVLPNVYKRHHSQITMNFYIDKVADKLILVDV